MTNMRVKLKPLKDQVMVITGASSGIGLTTAEMAVQRGARVVLAPALRIGRYSILTELDAPVI